MVGNYTFDDDDDEREEEDYEEEDDGEFDFVSFKDERELNLAS